MPIVGSTESGPGGRLELAVHGLAIQVALVVLLECLQCVVLVLEHHLSNAWGVHVHAIKRAHDTAQLLHRKGGYMVGEERGARQGD